MPNINDLAGLSEAETIAYLDKLKPKALRALLESGYPVDTSRIENHEFKGISLGIPKLFEKLTWKTFKKTFYRDPGTGNLRGWNVRIQQTGTSGEYLPKLKNGAPKTWGYYNVVPMKDRKSPVNCPQGQLIDYKLGGHSRAGIIGNLRDPLVSLHPDSSDMLLGWSYLDVAGAFIGTSSFFLLIKDKPLSHIADLHQKTEVPAHV